jgi:predicted RNase H-like HicB family nuclease
MSGKLTIIFEKDDFGYYCYCPVLPGCQSQGDTFEEAMANIKEAIDLYLECQDNDKTEIMLNKEIISTSVEVAYA